MKFLSKIILPINHPYLSNKYTQHYYNIINNAKIRILDKLIYVERHHIIPDCFYINNRSKGKRPGFLEGNSNEKENLVLLTPKEHFICHWLLTKMISGKFYYKMENALSYFTGSKKRRLILTSGQYSRRRIAGINSRKGIRNPRKNYKHSPESLAKMIANRRPYVPGSLVVSKETRKKMSLAKIGKSPSNKGIPHSEETIQKIKNKRKLQAPRINFKHTEETKQKLREKRKLQIMKPMSDETKRKIKESNIGHIVTEEIKEKLRQARKLQAPPSLEARIKMSKSRTGLLWWTNGTKNMKSKTCPGNGWIRGQIRNKSDAN